MQISEECMKLKAYKLKEEVHMLFKSFSSTSVEKMTMVDTLQKLGIDHLFEEHINMTLNEIHKCEFNGCSLYEVALRFGLLREHGLWVSPGICLFFSCLQLLYIINWKVLNIHITLICVVLFIYVQSYLVQTRKTHGFELDICSGIPSPQT
jgi:hypothetical protein